MKVEARTPVATLLLIAANIAAAFLLFLQPDLVDSFGFVASAPSLVPAVTNLFLHANLIHLLGNMVFLAAAGPATEQAVGPIRLLGVYFAGGLAGVAAHWILSPAKEMPLIGASGAVAACVVLSAVRFYRSRVMLAPSLSVPLFSLVFVWLALQIAGVAIRIGDPVGGTSYWAHLGGAMAGLLLALAYRAPQAADRHESERVLTEMKERGPAAALAAAERHLSHHPRDVAAHLHKAEALAQLGEKGNAATTLLQAASLASSTELQSVARCVAEWGCLEAIPSAQKIILAEKLKGSDSELASRFLESILEGSSTDESRPEAILGLADLRRETDPETAAKLVSELFQTYPLHPASDVARAKGWTP